MDLTLDCVGGFHVRIQLLLFTFCGVVVSFWLSVAIGLNSPSVGVSVGHAGVVFLALGIWGWSVGAVWGLFSGVSFCMPCLVCRSLFQWARVGGGGSLFFFPLVLAASGEDSTDEGDDDLGLFWASPPSSDTSNDEF